METGLKGGKADHQHLIEWFNAAEKDTFDARLLSERDRDYFDGWQLSDAEIAELKRRGQPPVAFNRVRPKIEFLKGLEAQRRTDPKAFPRTPQHAQGAEAATDSIRYVCERQDWDMLRSRGWENMLVEGMCAVELTHRPGVDGPEIVLNHYHWDRLFYDPHSRQKDFADARFMGAVIWADLDDVRKIYPSVKDLGASEESESETYSDFPKHHGWVDSSRNRIRIVLMWYRINGVWHWCKFTRDAWLEGGESPYVNENGQSYRPFLMQSAYVDRFGMRYGVVRDMIDPQDEINKRRSKSLFHMTARQVKMTKGAVDSVQSVRRELARPDGVIEVNRGDEFEFDILNLNDQTSGHLALLQEAKSEIELMGANAALSGETGESTSGRAVLARQQGGMVEIAPLFDALHHWTREVYRGIWMLIRQLWTEQKWIRVTDDKRNVRFVGLNTPYTVQDHLRDMPDDQAYVIARHFGFTPGDERMATVIGRQNAVESLDVDIILEEVPDQVSIQGETFDALVKLAPVVGQAVGPAYGQLLVEMAPLRTEARDKLLEGLEQAQQVQAPVQGAMIEAQARKAQAEAAQAERAAQTPLGAA